MWIKGLIAIILLTGWMTLADALSSGKFVQGQPHKEFEAILKDDFCAKNDKGGGQCARMNKNYLKFYFSIFATIAWGGIVRTVIKTFQLSIPYTVVLLITGLVLGLGSRISPEFCETWSMFTKFARTPPQLILYIFLPLLIFESAFSMHSHVFMQNFLSISIVALPGMLMSTLFTALACLQVMTTYKWTFSQAGLFGAIISATDPVAVVAILREVGTSENLSVMIEGESLLNDGVAILLFHILKESVEDPHEKGSAGRIFLVFVRIAIGGPLFGFFMGKLAIWCLTMIYNDAATEITITLVAAYLTYFVGEFYLEVSGVMAVVLLGVTINAGNTCISPEVMHTMHIFWEMMSFLANTVLFVILGIVISETAINSFEMQDGYYLIWLYFTINLIRLVMLFCLSPLLRRVGYETHWKNLTVMMWGGLRGAVGVCLALEVYRSKKICHFANVGPKFLLHTAGIVILTLIINGSTTKSLLDYLGVTTLSLGKLHDMAHVVKNLTGARVRTIIALKHDRFLADANWEIVHRFTHLMDPYLKFHKKAHEEQSRSWWSGLFPKKNEEDKIKKQYEKEQEKLEKKKRKSELEKRKSESGRRKSLAGRRKSEAVSIKHFEVAGHHSSIAEDKGDSMMDASARLNEKLVEEGYLTSAVVTRTATKGHAQTSNVPMIELRAEPTLLLIHQGKLKRPMAMGSTSKSHIPEEDNEMLEDNNDDLEDDIEDANSEFKKLMEESRSRVLKAMKISCWTQYEKGALSEEAVKVVVSAIEEKEDVYLKMLRVKDLQKHWKIKGFISWLRNKIHEMTRVETFPPKPKRKWRHPFWWLTTRSWFHGVIYFIIFLNLAPIIFETYLLVQGREPKFGAERDFLFYSTIVFTGVYLLEFLCKIIGRGVTDYCNSRWNLLDFFILVISLGEVIWNFFHYQFGPHGHVLDKKHNNASDKIIYLRVIRTFRFIRLLRWARPILPRFNKIIEIRVNARLFKGYNVGTGYLNALEDALRLLPTIVTNKIIFRKFRNLLDTDRLAVIRELYLLQMKHPGVVVAVKTRQASRAICGYMKEELETMKLEGLLEESEFALLTSKIDGNMKKLWASPNRLKLASIGAMIEILPWTIGNAEMLQYFKYTHEVRKFAAGDIIYNFGDQEEGIYLIYSGIVKLHYVPTDKLVQNLMERGVFPNSEFFPFDLTFATTQWDFMGIGSIIGEYGFLTDAPRDASLTCETDVEAVFWSNADLQVAITIFNDPFNSMEARLWRSWGIKLSAEYLHTTSQYGSWSSDKIRAHLEQGVVPVGENFRVLELPDYIQEVILIHGEVVNTDNSEVFQAPALIPVTWSLVEQKPGTDVVPRMILIAHEEDIVLLNESESQTSLDKVILRSPGVALSLKDHDSDFDVAAAQQRFSERRKSLPVLTLPKNTQVSRRKSTVEGQIKGAIKRSLTRKDVT